MIPALTTTGGFNPSQLFASGEQGAWYDPSDLTTLFQGSAGTTPVTAVEQPVGLMLDKSKGLVLGPELVTNGDFSNGVTGWTAYNAVISAVNGTLKVDDSSNLGANYSAVQQLNLVSGRTYLLTFDVVSVSGTWSVGFATSATAAGITFPSALTGKNTTGSQRFVFTYDGTRNFLFMEVDGTGIVFYDNISVRELPGNHAYQTTSANRPTLSARVNQFVNTETLATQNVTTVETTYTLRFEGTGSITLSGTKTGTYSAGTHSLTGVTAGTLTATVTGTVSKADFRVANDGVGIPAYQRVNTATNYDTVGFPKYLSFNGSSSAMMTNTITPGTDKAQVFAGVRKLFNMTGVICEFSPNRNSNNGSFTSAAASTSPSQGYGFFSKGTTSANAQVTTGYSAPITNVITGLGDISGDGSTLIINDTQAAINTGDQGTGNYLAYPLYIGARAGTSLWFNGRLYSMIVRFGSNLTTAQITNTEKYVNSKTKAY